MTPRTIGVASVDAQGRLEMTSVRSLLKAKGNDTLSVDPNLPVQQALARMRDHNVGSVLVCEGGRLIGLFAERQFARCVAERGPSCIDGVVRDLMDEAILYVSPETTIDECMALMTERRTRHLPVFDGDELVGIVSIGDVVKELIADKDYVIEQLERYIAGR
jgi:CBS domain-containing protein